MDSSEVNKKLLDLINGNYDPSELNHQMQARGVQPEDVAKFEKNI